MTVETPAPAPKQIKLAIVSPIYGSLVRAEQLNMYASIGWTLAISERRFMPVTIGHVDMNPVDRARNMAIAKAMLIGAEWLLMIDADTWCIDTPEDPAGFALLRMISEADRAGAAVVVAPVIRRKHANYTGEHELMIYRHVPSEGARPNDRFHPLLIKKDNIVTLPSAAFLARDKLIEIDFAATAVMAINLTHPAVTEDVRFKFTEELSEDFEFCRQIRAKGGQILCDPRVRTAHLSSTFPLVF